LLSHKTITTLQAWTWASYGFLRSSLHCFICGW